MTLRLKPHWLSLPISGQILVLLMGSLVAAQLATLGLTSLLPPKPPPQYDLNQIANSLKGEARGALVRTVDTLPPSLSSPGWVASPAAAQELAQLLSVKPSDVRLMFYAPPPFGGSRPPARAEAQAEETIIFDADFAGSAAGLLQRAVYSHQPGGDPGGGPPGGQDRFPGGGFPREDFPRDLPNRPDPPADRTPGPRSERNPPELQPPPKPPARTEAPADVPASAPANPPPKSGEALAGPTDRPPSLSLPPPSPPPVDNSGQTAPVGGGQFAPQPVGVTPMDASPSPPTDAPPSAGMARQTALEPAIPSSPPVIGGGLPVPVVGAASADAVPVDLSSGRTLAPLSNGGLFGHAGPSFVEGEFVAALRVSESRWVIVRPRPEGFPNSWQRRLMLWFAIAFALVAPIGYLFARRLTAPLRDFASAAERLGRDPQAQVSTREGPAEIGRAARAFNLMQSRLKRFIDDRTGMIGAISHDLRTPLARMRFRLERAPPGVRAAMDRDIDQMEKMISAVLLFMRDDAASRIRERVDLRSVLECVVDDASEAGGEVSLEPGPSVEVEVDLLGLQRVFENLVGNSLKYGERATVRLHINGSEAVTEVVDVGPGLPEHELTEVFKPFYRGAEARASAKGGIGLGLAVSRSTVRTHGGDLTLRRTEAGLVAEVRLPLAA